MNMQNIEYKLNADMTLEQFTSVYLNSTLSDRRPADDPSIMRKMMENSSITISAWDGEELVGISRTLTDFSYVAYLADLAVSKSFQGRNIGKRLVQETKAALEPSCMLVLLSAPAANEFYPKIGFSHNPRAWVLRSKDEIE